MTIFSLSRTFIEYEAKVFSHAKLTFSSVCPGSRALGECGGYLRHATRQEADDHHRPASASAGVSGERNTDDCCLTLL